MKKIFIILSFIAYSSSLTYAQTWQWAIKDSGNGHDGAGFISVDTAGNSFVYGGYSGQIYFNACGTLNDPTNPFDEFMAKYDKNGNCLSVKTTATEFNSYSSGTNALVIDKYGNFFTTGQYQDSMKFGAITLYGWLGQLTVFIAKYDKNGNIIWAKTGVRGSSNGIGVDDKENIYLTGAATGVGSISTCSINPGFFLVKLDSNGNCDWVKSSKGGIGSKIVTDSIGNCYVGGDVNHGDTVILGKDTLTCQIKNEVFIAKFDSGGNSLWAKSSWDTGWTGGIAFDVDRLGNSYIGCGSTNSPVYFGCDTAPINGSGATLLEKLNTYGNCVWCKKNYYLGNIRVDPKGDIYMSSYITSPITIGSCNIAGTGIFVTEFDSAGNCLWNLSANGKDNYPNCGIDCDKNGNCYLAGAINGPVTFGSTTLTNSSAINSSVFVAKINGVTAVRDVHQTANEKFTIYPNPSAGGYTMQISSDLLNSNMYIYDVLGKQVFQSKVIQEQSVIDIPSLAKGMYYVKIITPQGQSLQKTIVQQ